MMILHSKADKVLRVCQLATAAVAAVAPTPDTSAREHVAIIGLSLIGIISIQGWLAARSSLREEQAALRVAAELRWREGRTFLHQRAASERLMPEPTSPTPTTGEHPR